MAGLTEFERNILQAGFKFIDKNNDDRITLDELELMIKNLGYNYKHQQCIDMINVATKSKDKRVNSNEFLDRFIHRDQSELEKELNAAFDIITGDPDAIKISKSNLKNFFATVGMENVTDEEVNEIMEIAGTGGKLSKEELVKMLFVD